MFWSIHPHRPAHDSFLCYKHFHWHHKRVSVWHGSQAHTATLSVACDVPNVCHTCISHYTNRKPWLMTADRGRNKWADILSKYHVIWIKYTEAVTQKVSITEVYFFSVSSHNGVINLVITSAESWLSRCTRPCFTAQVCKIHRGQLPALVSCSNSS